MNLSELKKIIQKHEHERAELKEWKGSISVLGQMKLENRSKCILGYCVALGNEGGGYLIIGVNNNKKIVGTKTILDINQTKKQIFDNTNQKIEIKEVYDGDNKVLVVHIPSRPIGQTLKYHDVPLMRVGESVEKMTDDVQTQILLEKQKDFSMQICEKSSLINVDKEALKRIRLLYQEKNPRNTSIKSLSDDQFLMDIGLLKQGKLTYSGVILIAHETFLDEEMPQVEICFEYRNKKVDIQYNERIDYRAPFILLVSKIWEKVLSRQQTYSFVDGLFRRDIPAFNEEVFREALFNAVCHRDYTQQGSIIIKQSPEEIEISNPGGFPQGVTAENIISVPSTPRNRNLAEMFQKIFKGVERSGQGADKIFRFTIEEGKGMPDYSNTDTFHVCLGIPASLKDGKFIQYLEKVIEDLQVSLSVEDIVLLEKIREGNFENITLKTVKHLLDMGLIELHGKTRGAKYILSDQYYKEIGALGERTRRIGLSRGKCKELILEHIRKYKSGRISEFTQIFPELKRTNIANFITELKNERKIKKGGGNTRGAYWIIN